MKRKLVAMIVSALLIASVAAVAFAQLYMTVQWQNHVSISATGNIELFSDAECTVPLDVEAVAEWGSDLHAGDQVTKTVYVKNVGSTTAYVAWSMTGMTKTGGNYYFGDSAAHYTYWFAVSSGGTVWSCVTVSEPPMTLNARQLEPGQSMDMVMTLSVTSNVADIEPNDLLFNILVSSYGSQTG